MDYDAKDALDNKRRVMKSSIFGDSSEPIVVSDYQPKFTSTDNTKTSYDENLNTVNTNYQSPDPYPTDNYQFSTQITQPSTYQSQSSANSFAPSYQPMSTYQPKQSIAPSMVDETPIRIPKIEKIEQPPPLPTLTPFPEFRFDPLTPIGPLDLGIRPRESKSQSNPQNPQKTPYFSVGDALQKIRNDLMQEAANCNNRMQKIMKNNDDLQINNVDLLSMQKKSEFLQTTQTFENNELPQFTTSSQFMFPDGSTMTPT